MLIRHECCGVGAPRSGGGTPCATQRDGGALVLQELIICAHGLKTHGSRVRKQHVFEEELKRYVE